MVTKAEVISNDPEQDIAPISPFGAVEYQYTTEQLAKLIAESKGIKKVSTLADVNALRPFIARLREHRIDLDRQRKSLKEGVLTHGRLVDSEAKALVEIIQPEEQRLQAIAKKFTDALAAEKQKKFEADKKRTDDHKAMIQSISDTPGTLIKNGAGIAELEAQINEFDYNDLSVFEEFADQAAGALATALSVLKGMLTLAQGQAEQAKKDEAHEVERQRIIDAAAEVEADRIANEKEADRLTKEKTDQEAKIVRDKEAAAKKISDDAAAAKQKIADDKAAAKQKIIDDKATAKAEKKRLADIKKARPDSEKLILLAQSVRDIELPQLDNNAVGLWIETERDELSRRIVDRANLLIS